MKVGTSFSLVGCGRRLPAGVFKLSFPSRSEPLPRVVVLANSEAANGKLRGFSTYTQVASGRSAAVESRTSESRVAAVTCTRGSSLQLCPCPLLLSDHVKCVARRVAYSLAYIQSWPVPMNDPTPPAYY